MTKEQQFLSIQKHFILIYFDINGTVFPYSSDQSELNNFVIQDSFKNDIIELQNKLNQLNNHPTQPKEYILTMLTSEDISNLNFAATCMNLDRYIDKGWVYFCARNGKYLTNNFKTFINFFPTKTKSNYLALYSLKKFISNIISKDKVILSDDFIEFSISKKMLKDFENHELKLIKQEIDNLNFQHSLTIQLNLEKTHEDSQITTYTIYFSYENKGGFIKNFKQTISQNWPSIRESLRKNYNYNVSEDYKLTIIGYGSQLTNLSMFDQCDISFIPSDSTLSEKNIYENKEIFSNRLKNNNIKGLIEIIDYSVNKL